MTNRRSAFASASALLLAIFLCLFNPNSADAAPIVLKDPETGTRTTSSYPFNSSNMCVQTMVFKELLNNQKGTITSFGLRFTTTFSKTWPNVRIYLGETSRTGAQLSTTFATNYDVKARQQVYSGSLSMSSNTSNNFLPRVTLQTPFEYTGVGNLLVEFRVSGSASGSGGVTHRLYYNTTPLGRRIWTSNANATVGTSNQSYNYGWSLEMEQGEDLTWTGATSDAWNLPQNWTPAQVPSDSDTVTIPDASTTNNDPKLPSNAKCSDLTIENGGVLDGSSGKIDVSGDWVNEGTFNKGTSTVAFVDSGNQSIDDAANEFSTLLIQNGRATLENNVNNGNSSYINVQSKAELAFAGSTVDLRGVSFNNSGKFVFGASGVNQSVTLDTDERLKNVIVNPPGSNDQVTFAGTGFYFDALELEGNGDIVFSGELKANAGMTTKMGSSGSVSATAFTGGGDWYFEQSHSITETFNVPGGDIFYSGSGSLTLIGDRDGYIEHDGTGSMTIQGDFNGSDIEYTGSGPFRLTGDFDGSSLTHDGTGSVSIDGEWKDGEIYLDNSGSMTIDGDLSSDAIEMTGGTNFTAESDAMVDSLIQEGIGTLGFEGDLTISDDLNLEPDSGRGTLTILGSLNVSGDVNLEAETQASARNLWAAGDATIDGDLNVVEGNAKFDGQPAIDGDVSIENTGTLEFGNLGDVIIASLTMDDSAELSADGTLIVGGATTLRGDATVSLSGNMTVQSHFNNLSTESVEVNGTFTVDGSNSAVEISLNLMVPLQANNFVLDSVNGVKLEGEIKGLSASVATPAIAVSSDCALTLQEEAILSIGSGYLSVAGSLVSTYGSGALPPKVSGAVGLTSQGTVIFESTGICDLHGFTFERIGNANNDYAVIFEAGSELRKLDLCNFPDSAASVAIIDLNTTDCPHEILGPKLGGTSPANINTTDITDIKVTVLMGTTGGGALYGKQFEIDPRLVLFWDESPVVLIQDPEQVTLGYVGRPYSYYVPVAGGNPPYIYSLENAPAWMTIDKTSGEIGGTPTQGDLGSGHTFDVLVGDSTEVGFPPVPLAPVRRTLLIDIEIPPYFPVTITSDPDLGEVRANTEFAFSIEIFDGVPEFEYSLVGAQTWMDIDAESGEISGVPPILFEGPLTFNVQVNDGNPAFPPVQKQFNMVVSSSGYEAIRVPTPSVLPSIEEGDAIAADIMATHGVAPYTYEFAEAPGWANTILSPIQSDLDPVNWLSIDPATGVVSGRAPLGIFDRVIFSVEVGDTQTAIEGSTAPTLTKVFAFDVTEIHYDPISVDSESLLPNATQGVPFSFQILTSKGLAEHYYSLENNPIWLSVNAATGLLEGVPPSTFSGFLNFTLVVSDDKAGASPTRKDFSIQVLRAGDDQLLVNTPPLLFAAEAGAQYHVVLAASGGAGDGFTWALALPDTLPPGLSLSADGVISGTPLPTLSGEYIFDVIVTDAAQDSTTQTLSLSVQSPNEGITAVDNNVDGFNLPDRGPSGGCAIDGKNSSGWLLFFAAIMLAVMALRRRLVSEA